MANGKLHAAVGGTVGGGFAYITAVQQPPPQVVLEIIGGCFGGVVGAKAPDWVDPPTSPNHRGIGHGAIPVSVVAKWYLDNLQSWQTECRVMVEDHARYRNQSQTDLERMWHGFLEMMFRLFAGFLAGLPAGYLSHIGLDVLTPKCLPVIC